MRIGKLFLVAAFALTGCLIDEKPGRHPTDAELLKRFRDHRAELEQLIRMFESDKGLGRVGSNFTRPENPAEVGISTERIEEYHRLCSAVGAANCIEGYDAAYYRLVGSPEWGLPAGEEKNPIWIHVSAIGLSISGSSKGFLYSRNPPFEEVPDLDRWMPESSGTRIRHIEGPWYLYYDYED